MSCDWSLVQLGDVAELLVGFPFKSADYTEDAESPRLLRGDNLAQGTLRWNGVKRWPISKTRDVDAYWLQEDDVVLAMDRPWIDAGLKYAVVRDHDLPALLVQRVARIRGSHRLDTRFLRWVIGSPVFTHHVLAVQTGTAVPHISATQIRSFVFHLPSLPEQRAIAHILGTLDDKIELNRRMNQTLEEIARAIFKSWFIDFDPVRAKAEGREPEGMDAETAALFPDAFVDSKPGEIPAGWLTSDVGTIAYVIDCLHSKKPERLNDGLTFLQLNNIRDDGLLDLSTRYYISDADYCKWTTRIEAMEGDCAITNVGRIGAVSQIPPKETAALGRNMTGIRCKEDFPYPTFLIECLLSESMKEEIRRKQDSGTILDALNVKNVPRLRFVCGSDPVLTRFEALARPLRMRMEHGLAESKTLSAMRDLLLPKLLSGELRVPDAERLVEQHV